MPKWKKMDTFGLKFILIQGSTVRHVRPTLSCKICWWTGEKLYRQPDWTG